jgi:formate dehydrogenase beta subunit
VRDEALARPAGALMNDITSNDRPGANGSLTINGTGCPFEKGDTILDAAFRAGVYIPNLCYHPDLPPPDTIQDDPAVYRGSQKTAAAMAKTAEERAWNGCGLCLVEIAGMDEPVRACVTWARDGMEISPHTERVKELRRRNLAAILAEHPHACLTCAEREGCTRDPCSLNVPVEERCCPLLGQCQLQKVVDYIGLPEGTPKYKFANLPILGEEPLYTIDYNLCISCGRCVRACTALRDVGALGAARVGDKLIVGTKAEGGLRSSNCRFCGACVEVCPTGALRDKVGRKGTREERLVPCRATCPAGVDVPQYIRLIAEGRYKEATLVIRESAPLPRTLGSACFRPCEDQCRRSALDSPVAICALKRFAAERELEGPPPPEARRSGRKIAVVGSGPAGLSCAWFLARKGHSVEVLESEDEPGGMMTQAIPDFRLPKETVFNDIEAIKAQGIRIRTSSPVNGTDGLSALFQEGFDAVFVAAGNSTAKKIDIPGSEGPGTHWGLDLLRDVKAGARPELGKRAVVIGGGNVAVDTALTVNRLGTAEVHMVCLEKRDEMPAHHSELERALAEGVILHNSWGPSRVLSDARKVRGVEFVRCTRVFDSEGKFNPSFDRSETHTVDCDSVVLAIGQELGPDFLGTEIAAGSRLINSDVKTCVTAIDGVFAGGEAARGPLSIIDAISEGRKAASAIDKFLGGDGELDEVLVEQVTSLALGKDDGFATRSRVAAATIPVGGRSESFEQVEGVYTEEQAKEEAGRCLQCDLRLTISSPFLPPERSKLVLGEDQVAAVPEAPGVYELFDEGGEVIQIKGTPNLKRSLEEELAKGRPSLRFEFDENPMYSQRESELIQQYLQKHGRMPGGSGDDLDDLF